MNTSKAENSTIPDYDLFSDYERSLVPKVLAGETVVVAMNNFCRPYTPFLRWAKSKGLVVKIDRTSKDWGNPFRVGDDGDISDVMSSYAEHYLPCKFDLMRRIPLELKGKVLACWCKKDNKNIPGLPAEDQPCHGDILAAIANSNSLRLI